MRLSGCHKWIVVFVVMAVIAFLGWKTYQLHRGIQRALDFSRKETLQRRSLKLHRQSIAPQFKEGFSLLTARIQPDGVRWFRDHLFVSSNEGLLQLDRTGREVQRYTVLDGLPGHRFTAIESSTEGLWVGVAPQGLLRFDGHEFQYYFADRAQDFEITSLLALPAGDLLVGTKQRGLLVYRGGEAHEFEPRIAAKFISALHGDDHRLLVGTFSEGLYIVQQGVVKHLDRRSSGSVGLPDSQVTALASADTTIYVATPLGVAEIEDDQVVRSFANDLTVLSLGATPRLLLVGTSSGLFGFSQGRTQGITRRVTSPNRPEKGNVADHESFLKAAGVQGPVYQLVHGGADTWLALTADGVYASDLLDEGSWRAVREFREERPGLSDTNVSSLALDRDRSVWIGYFDRGLDVIGSDGTRRKHEENDQIFCVNHISELPDGRMAVATANGIGLYEAGSLYRFVTEREGLVHNSVAMVYPLASDRTIAATAQGVSILSRGVPVQNFFALHGLANNHVYCAASFANRIYLGTLSGLTVVDGSGASLSRNISNSGLKANWITSLAPSEKQLFVGSYGGGVQSVDASGQWTDHSAYTGSIEVNPNAMIVDGHQLFVGTLDQGLLIYDLVRERWGHLRKGLPSQNITAFAVESDSLLVGTDRGVVKIQKNVLQAML